METKIVFLQHVVKLSTEELTINQKKTGERKYLVDEVVGIKPHTKMSSDVVVKVIDSAVDGSYRLSGEKAVNTEAVIS